MAGATKGDSITTVCGWEWCWVHRTPKPAPLTPRPPGTQGEDESCPCRAGPRWRSLWQSLRRATRLSKPLGMMVTFSSAWCPESQPSAQEGTASRVQPQLCSVLSPASCCLWSTLGWPSPSPSLDMVEPTAGIAGSRTIGGQGPGQGSSEGGRWGQAPRG